MNCVKKIIFMSAAILATLLLARIFCGPLIWQNLTDSGPHGIYIYAPNQQLKRGDWCVVNLPHDVPGLHVSKGYKLIKQVRAFNGEAYEIQDKELILHNKTFPITRATYLPQLQNGNYVVPTNHYMFLNEPVLSFDSRYFGPVNADDIQCKVIFILDYDEINQFLLTIRSCFR